MNVVTLIVSPLETAISSIDTSMTKVPSRPGANGMPVLPPWDPVNFSFPISISVVKLPPPVEPPSTLKSILNSQVPEGMTPEAPILDSNCAILCLSTPAFSISSSYN